MKADSAGKGVGRAVLRADASGLMAQDFLEGAGGSHGLLFKESGCGGPVGMATQHLPEHFGDRFGDRGVLGGSESCDHVAKVGGWNQAAECLPGRGGSRLVE